MNAVVKLLFATALVLLLGACVTARRSEPIVGDKRAEANAFAEGRRVFVQHCHPCHPGGEAGLGPAINNKPLPQALMKFQVRHGLGAMPSFKPDHISSQELDQLTAYLVALRKSG
jgi:mono/diheme cytochrome c family protein